MIDFEVSYTGKSVTENVDMLDIDLRFTGYNRPEYFLPVVHSWNNVRGIERTHATLHLEPSDPVTEQKMMDAFYQLKAGAHTLVLNHSRYGVLLNPWKALEAGFKRSEKVILAEDDVIVSSDILEFMDFGLTVTPAHPDLMGVCAFSREGGPEHIYEVRKSFSPLIWGTTRDIWVNYLRDTWDKDYTSGNADGSQAGWDWNINRILSAQDKYFIYPLASRSDHIGEHKGTHMMPEMFHESRGVDFKLSRSVMGYTPRGN